VSYRIRGRQKFREMGRTGSERSSLLHLFVGRMEERKDPVERLLLRRHVAENMTGRDGAVSFGERRSRSQRRSDQDIHVSSDFSEAEEGEEGSSILLGLNTKQTERKTQKVSIDAQRGVAREEPGKEDAPRSASQTLPRHQRCSSGSPRRSPLHTSLPS
jgi:hypothetical protein